MSNHLERAPVGIRMDRLPLGSFHRWLLILLGVGMAFFSYEIYVLAAVMVVFVEIGWVTTVGSAHVIGSVFLGALLGSLIGGYLSDRFGRKIMLRTNMLVYGLASLGRALAPGFDVFLIFNVLAGFGVGAHIPTGYSAFGEFVPPRERGKMSGLLALVTNLGQPVALLIATLLIPAGGWRWLFVVGAVPTLLLWWIQRKIPESPRWLESVGKYTAAGQIMADIENKFKTLQSTLDSLPPVSASIAPGAIKKLPFSKLFTKVMLRRTVFACILAGGINMTMFGFTTIIPTMFVEQGLVMAKSLSISTIMLIGAPLGAVVTSLLAEKGRKKTMVFYILMSIVVGYGFVLVLHEIGKVILGLFLVLFLHASLCLAFSTYIVELFPTSLRSSGHGLAMAFGRFCAIFFPYVTMAVLTSSGVRAVVFMIIAIFFLEIIITLVLGEETKGKTLEELSLKIS